ncbi:transcription elongation factor [Punctularia strigosozonata HHB-11173 SS5]|uniref:transcription elongation factor n=1 Tax=Punctularia strigosozonata (strain HHB-11173) TaxID=741275 RepID=UPI0004417F79|nr:transcription elongation factor [Punctularia strigosozonata HHB-11173 SS5]EIN06825.1 transcription elongation factor [Punctularia strigosozonata HHB-11173 SS5]
MSDAAELKSLAKQLQGSSSEQEIKDVLAILKKDAKITEAWLRESKIGLAVGKLRSHANRDISNLAKEVVKKWKAEVEKEKETRGSSATPSTPGGASTTASTPKPPPVRKASIASSVGAPPASPATTIASPTTYARTSLPTNGAPRTAKLDGISMDVTSDKTRDKCIELIYDALASDSSAPADLVLKRARGIESDVLSQFRTTGAEYKAKIRSFFVNLKDKNNPGLRAAVVSGELPVEKFAKMTSADMASEERRAQDQKIREENLFQSLGAEEQQAETDAFQCSRCKQRKCRYRQAQTRSADEPMTTFVTCTVCNNRWKFS